MSDPPNRRRIRPLRPGPQFQQRKGIVVLATRLWELFRQERILERVLAGELTAVVIHQNPPDPRYNQDEGTVSQTIAYRSKDGKTVAEAHQFLKRDGTLGA